MIKLYVLFQAAMQAHWRPLTCWHSLSWHRTCIPAVWTWTTPVLRWEQVKHPGDWGDCAVLHWCLFVIVPYVFVKWWFCVGCCAVLQCFYFKTNVPYNKIYCIILYRTKQHSIITHRTVSYSIILYVNTDFFLLSRHGVFCYFFPGCWQYFRLRSWKFLHSRAVTYRQDLHEFRWTVRNRLYNHKVFFYFIYWWIFYFPDKPERGNTPVFEFMDPDVQVSSYSCKFSWMIFCWKVNSSVVTLRL